MTSTRRNFVWSIPLRGATPATRVAAFGTLLGGAALATLLLLLERGFQLGDPLAVLALSSLAVLAERRTIRLSATTELSVSFLPIVFAAMIFGPLAAMTVGALGMLTQLGAPYLRWLIWTSSRVLVGAGAGIAAVMVGTPDSSAFWVLLGGAAAAAVVEALLDFAFGAATVAVRGRGSVVGMFRMQAPVLMARVPLYIPVLAVLAYAYHHLSPWSVVLFLLPAFVAQRLHVLYREQRESARNLAAANERLERANTSFAAALVATLEARDRYTAGHSTAVAVYARDIAERLGLSEDDQRRAHLSGLVHDIGKIGLPPGLLEKTGPLKLAERREMEKHAAIGEKILANVEDYAEIATIVRHHHERMDGMGYPDGIAGDRIPLTARIIAVADAYNAMTSDRPYRDAMPSRVARLRLAQAAASQFDTNVVAAFEAILAGATEEYRSGRMCTSASGSIADGAVGATAGVG